MSNERINYEYFAKHGNEEPGAVYVLKIFDNEESFFKIGITKAGTIESFNKRRAPFIKEHGYNLELLFFFNTTLYEAYHLEQAVIWMLEPFVHLPQKKFNGSTECFKEDPLGILFGQPQEIEARIIKDFSFWTSHLQEASGEVFASDDTYFETIIGIAKRWLPYSAIINQFLVNAKENIQSSYNIEIPDIAINKIQAQFRIKLRALITRKRVEISNHINLKQKEINDLNIKISETILSLRRGNFIINNNNIITKIKMSPEDVETIQNYLNSLNEYKEVLEPFNNDRIASLRKNLAALARVNL